jgi:hypothetical protein
VILVKLFNNAKQIEPWLIDRGLSRDDIKSDLVLLVGDDWDNISGSEFFARLQNRGYTVKATLPALADEVEVLVRGALILKSLRNQIA